jgi:hypothetical protein
MKCNLYRNADLLGRERFNEDFENIFITAGTENDMDKIDIFATARTDSGRTYAIEVKNYENSEFPRSYGKFTKNGVDYGYMIDYDKLDYLCKVAAAENRTPILYARFLDWTIAWNLNNVPWRDRKRTMKCNADGQNYGKKKEDSLVTYLYIEESAWKKETNKEKNIMN